MCQCADALECEVCGSMERIIEFQGARICEECLSRRSL